MSHSRQDFNFFVSAKSYQSGDLGESCADIGCNVVTDLEECRTAIESTGDTITSDWSANTVNFVFGCSMEGSTLHYNTNSNGSPRMSGKPYCCCGDCSGNLTSYIIL